MSSSSSSFRPISFSIIIKYRTCFVSYTFMALLVTSLLLLVVMARSPIGPISKYPTRYCNCCFIHSCSRLLLASTTRQKQQQQSSITFKRKQNCLYIKSKKREEQQPRQNCMGSSSAVNNIEEESDDSTFQKKITNRHQYWIVLVDDEESILIAVGDYLYDNGYQVTACIDSDSLIDLLLLNNNQIPQHLIPTNDATTATNISPTTQQQQNKQRQKLNYPNVMNRRLPDVLIIDIRMPQSTLNGLEIVEWIRNDNNMTTTTGSNNKYDNDIIKKNVEETTMIRNKLRSIPIVLLTAKGLTQDRIVGYKAGANVYLSKPFDPNELLSILDNLIARKEQQQQKENIFQGIIDNDDNQQQQQLGELILLDEMKNDIETIKSIIKQNQMNVIKDTDVYLTLVERNVLEYISLGYTNEEIAIARNTTQQSSLKRIIQNLYIKTSTLTRTELIKWAIETGYVNRKQRRIRK